MDEKSELLKEIFHTMEKIKRHVGHLICMHHAEKGATMLQMKALSFIEAHPQRTVGELAEMLSMSSSAITQFIDRLLESKMIAKVQDEKDRRIVRLVISEIGKTELKKVNTIMHKKMSKLFDCLSIDELKTMLSIQNKLIEKFEREQNV